MTVPPDFQNIAVYTPAAAAALVAGLANDPNKDPVRVATAGALPANTRVGNVLTANANGSLNTGGIDGKTDLAVNQRVLVKDEATGANKGIYYITSLGGVSSKWSMTRATDADTSDKVKSGMTAFASEGTANAGTTWTLTTADPITLNTTALTFENKATTVAGATAGSLGAVQLAGGLAGTGSTAALPVLDVSSGNVSGVLPGANIWSTKTVTIDHTADGFGALAPGVQTFDKNVGTALPANARTFVAISTAFTGFDDATHAAYTMTLGTSAGGNEVGTSLNVAAGQTGFPKPFAAGAQGYPLSLHSTDQLQIRLTGGVDLNTVTAGAITITVYYVVLA